MPESGGPARWFLVSKPLRRPFADGSSVLVRTLVQASDPGRAYTYFGDPRAPLRGAGLDRVVSRPAMGHAPTMLAKASVLAELARPRHRRSGLHFFFTPNPITSRAVRALQRLNPRRRVVQSIMSAAGVEAYVPLLAGLDAVIVLSDHTRERLLAAGLPALQVHRIYPGVPIVQPETQAAAPRILYAGDLDPRTAARLIACARGMCARPGPAWQLVIACRPKGEGDAQARATLRRELAAELAEGRVELHGHVQDFDALMRGCGCQLYAADHVNKKVDLPLAVLEGLARGLGLLALDFRPLNEIFDRAQEMGLQVGARLPADSEHQALGSAFAAALPTPEQAARWRAQTPTLVREHFSATALASAHQDLYQRLDVRHG